MTPVPSAPASRDGGDSRDERGFTLLELMVVMTILGLLILLVPPSLDGIGSRSRLEAGANTISAVLTGAREQAIIDGHEVRVQFQLGDAKRRTSTGRYRYVVVNKPRERPGQEDQVKARTEAKEEMVPLTWRGLPDGVILAAYSQVPKEWTKGSGGDAVIEIRYLPDGAVRPTHAWRLVSTDFSGPDSTMTVLVNALTGTPSVESGEADLPEVLDASDFR